MLIFILFTFVTSVLTLDSDYTDIFQNQERGSCSAVEGKISGCAECYFCNHTLVKLYLSQERRVLPQRLTLVSGECLKEELCCLPQSGFDSVRSGENCGQHNPDGVPRKRRSSARAVLQGEYPWRAWIYTTTNSKEPLCAATYIRENKKALIAPASCVADQNANSIVVSFTKGARVKSDIKLLTIHENYDPKTGNNDIAIISLWNLESVPRWAAPACLPAMPALHASPCLTISTDDKIINTVIPMKSQCVQNNKAIHDSLMCAFDPPINDNPTLKGSGLYCKEQYVTMASFIVYGMVLKKQDDIQTTYTNVTHFSGWIHRALARQ